VVAQPAQLVEGPKMGDIYFEHGLE
jgi:hypothetical protein